VTAAQAPLPAIIEVRRAAVVLDVLADHITGLVVIQPRSWPRPVIQVALEVTLITNLRIDRTAEGILPGVF
jgi:hypothetical protein